MELETETKKSVKSVKDELTKRLRLCREPLGQGSYLWCVHNKNRKKSQSSP